MLSAVVNGNNLVSNWTVSFNMIPYYLKTLSASDMSALNSRPKAATDFVSGQASVTQFDNIAFGADIGYSHTNCSLGKISHQCIVA